MSIWQHGEGTRRPLPVLQLPFSCHCPPSFTSPSVFAFSRFFFYFFFLVYIRLPFLFDVLCFFGQHLMPVTRVIPAGQDRGGGGEGGRCGNLCTYIHT